MYSHFASKRRAAEQKSEEPRFHWRTRVNSLMNEDETNKSQSPKHKSESDPLPIYPTDDIASNEVTIASGTDRRLGRDIHHRDEITTPRARLGFERRRADADFLDEERRRDRFVRTNSDSRLKMRVRFSKEESLETSKSLDADDESNGQGISHSRMRQRRRSRSTVKSGTGSLDRSEADLSEDDADDDDFMGACGGSFDSGLDLRGSSSPEDDDDDGYMNEDIQRELRRAESEHVGNSELLEATSRDEATRYKASESVHSGGAIPKTELSNNSRRDMRCVHDIKDFRSFPEEKMSEERFDEGRRHKGFNSSLRTTFGGTAEPEKDYFRDPSPETLPDKASDQNMPPKDFSPKENTPPHQRPGYGFFCDDIDGIEEIIQKIISEEEEAVASKENDRRFGCRIPMINEEELQNEVDELRKAINECNYECTADGTDVDEGENDRSRSIFRRTEKEPHLGDDQHRTKNGNKEEEEKDEQTSYDGEDDSWSCVPKILLEDIFTLLTPKDRHQASQVCRQWYDLFYSPRVWETFILLERTLTKKRFNLYKGYQRELCPWKTQLCLRRVGSFFKRIVITPITDYFNLCEFLRVLAAFLQYQEEHGENAMPLLHTFDFTFACATRGEDGVMVHGTGGQILDMIVKLLIQMSGLKHLKLNQLLTDMAEVENLFSALTNCFGESLNSLEMLNVTKVPFGLPDLSLFRNLIKLTVSPQHLNEEVLVLLAGLNLLHLHLIQDVYTCQCEPVSWEAWKLLKEMAPWMRVYLEVSGNIRSRLLIQPRAPVYGVFLRTPFGQLNYDLLTEIVEQYSKTLRYLVQETLPRIHGPRNFDKRCDSSLLFLVRQCRHLHTLVVSERMSTASLILIASEGKNLSTLLVRQNALIKRCDWPSRGEWSREFYRRLKTCALDYDKCTREVCTILRHRWRPLSDKQFMRLKIVPKVDIF